jgi:hypothetical protein
VIRIEIGPEDQARLDALANRPDMPFPFRCATSGELALAFDLTVLEIARNALDELERRDPALEKAMTRRLAMFQTQPVVTGGMVS